jgi:LacI family transcriptional regulator
VTGGKSTIYEVAERSGVSIATVSRAVRDGRGMSDATRTRVLEVARELDWVPNGRARALVTKRAGIVGLLFPDFSASGDTEEQSPLYVDEVIRGAERAASKVGDAVLIAATHTVSGRDLAYSVATKVDGLMIVAGSLGSHDIEILSRTMPVVVLAGRVRAGHSDSVRVDNQGGSRALVTHLIEVHGATDLAYIGGPPRTSDSNERFAGFRDAMRAAGLPYRRTPDATGGFTQAGGARAVATMLANGRCPDAIVCGNDEMAIGALGALRQAAIRVPTRVGVTGFDDIAAARTARPSLTTIQQPMRDLGDKAVNLLLERIGSKRWADGDRRLIRLPTTPIFRRSCGCGGRSGRRPSATPIQSGRRDA